MFNQQILQKVKNPKPFPHGVNGDVTMVVGFFIL